jgi:hypothetical protein
VGAAGGDSAVGGGAGGGGGGGGPDVVGWGGEGGAAEFGVAIGEGDVLAVTQVVERVPDAVVGGGCEGVEVARGGAGALFGRGIGSEGDVFVAGVFPPRPYGAVGFPGVGEGVTELGEGLEVVVGAACGVGRGGGTGFLTTEGRGREACGVVGWLIMGVVLRVGSCFGGEGGFGGSKFDVGGGIWSKKRGSSWFFASLTARGLSSACRYRRDRLAVRHRHRVSRSRRRHRRGRCRCGVISPPPLPPPPPPRSLMVASRNAGWKEWLARGANG